MYPVLGRVLEQAGEEVAGPHLLASLALDGQDGPAVGQGDGRRAGQCLKVGHGALGGPGVQSSPQVGQGRGGGVEGGLHGRRLGAPCSAGTVRAPGDEKYRRQPGPKQHSEQ